MRRWILQVIPVILLLPGGTVDAQVLPGEPSESPTGVHHIFLPAVAYTSDLGFIGGGLGQRIDYGEGVRPFKNATVLTLSASTKGLLSARLNYDRTRTFNREIRSGLDLRLERFLNQNYFGIGNESRFSRAAWDEEYYFYEHREVRLNYTARLPLSDVNGLFHQPPGIRSGDGADGSSLYELLFLYELVYNSPRVTDEGSLYDSESPFGREGGWIHAFGLGLMVDKRDSEFDPRRGARYELRWQYAPSFLGDYGHGRAGINLRHYLPVSPSIVLAHQLDLKRSHGDIPFWNLPVIGSENELRGYPEFRYRGAATWYSITEIRAWFYEIPEMELKLGIHGFWDTGRVFSGDDGWGDTFRDLKHTFGFGGAVTLFSPDLIFRGDIGFSEDMYRIYIGVGFLF